MTSAGGCCFSGLLARCFGPQRLQGGLGGLGGLCGDVDSDLQHVLESGFTMEVNMGLLWFNMVL